MSATNANMAALTKTISRLERRVRELERHSHPPIDLTPAIMEILAEQGFARTPDETTRSDVGGGA